MLRLAVLLVAAPILIAAYAYVGYPLVLWLVAKVRTRPPRSAEGGAWPFVTVTVPVYNAAGTIATTLERLLALDYPRAELQLLVISDASSDGTDAVVRTFASRGVELLRLPERRGKTTAENVALSAARGEIIVNVDATVHVPAWSLKALVRTFDDPSVGLASGRDVSVGDVSKSATYAEKGYVGYEMWIRDLETQVGSIVGASGCFYAIRRRIHATPLPPDLSWDFASALTAHEMGYRAISVPDAICFVPRTGEVRTELRRKVRTMARGLQTLHYKRALMNPFRYGSFALMLISHKLMRWLPYLFVPPALLSLVFLARQHLAAQLALAAVGLAALAGAAAVRRWVPRYGSAPFALAGFAVTTCVAGMLAWRNALARSSLATWEPTPRAEARLQ